MYKNRLLKKKLWLKRSQQSMKCLIGITNSKLIQTSDRLLSKGRFVETKHRRKMQSTQMEIKILLLFYFFILAEIPLHYYFFNFSLISIVYIVFFLMLQYIYIQQFQKFTHSFMQDLHSKQKLLPILTLQRLFGQLNQFNCLNKFWKQKLMFSHKRQYNFLRKFKKKEFNQNKNWLTISSFQ